MNLLSADQPNSDFENSAPPSICQNCDYFGAAMGVNVCRRMPPNPNFPVVAVDDWCGEFKLNKKLAAEQRLRILSRIDQIREERENSVKYKPYRGHKSGAGDYVISGYRLICTCSACPEQYDVFDDSTGLQVAYFRLRHGYFRADLYEAGGPEVYSENTIGDGMFTDNERLEQLKNAVNAVKEALVENVKSAKKSWHKTQD